MSAIKEIYDTVQDLAKNKVARDNIRAELKDELRLNLDFLKPLKSGEKISPERLKMIVRNLEISELDAFLKSPFPKNLICAATVTPSKVKDIPARKLLRSAGKEPVDFEELTRRIRRMIRFAKKDFRAIKNPYKSVSYIRNYIRVALRLLR
jgi:hypothetical protein